MRGSRKPSRPIAASPSTCSRADPDARRLGRSIFNNTCATCHGSSAQGAVGYPNLTDDIWHWGGSPDRVLQTVLDGREGVMPEWGKVLTGMGGAARSRATSPRTCVRCRIRRRACRTTTAPRGASSCSKTCVPVATAWTARASRTLGAPDLTDDYWLYGDDSTTLRATIANGRKGSMPAHRALLGETRARLVAAYVWSLSHPAPAPVAGAQR